MTRKRKLVERGAVVLAPVDLSVFDAARAGARVSMYGSLVRALAEGVPVDVTASLRPTGTSRTTRSAVLNAARKAGVVVQTAVTPEGSVLVLRVPQESLAPAPKRRRRRKS